LRSRRRQDQHRPHGRGCGVAGLIKTGLALRHAEIPATLHFTKPNPALGLAGSPFFVPERLTPWPSGATPRRAGISAFGVGGTNAHLCLEEAAAPAAHDVEESRPQLIVLSARNPAALERMSTAMAAHLDVAHESERLCDVAFTLQTVASRCACVVA
jgi:phthiocerol/phenolphthiocerol synthesis type-I polyketide synthase E